MMKPYRMTTIAAAMTLLALAAACEEQKAPEEKVQEQVKQPAEGTGKATPPQAEDTTE